MKKLIQLNYPLDMPSLLKDAEIARISATGYTDSRYPDFLANAWKKSIYSSSTIEQMMKDFDIVGKPRFYFQEPYYMVPRHTDNGTTCSFNFVLSDEPVPISFDDEDIIYSQALLNTTLPHAVRNGPHERILLKISIFDKSFEEVAKTLKYVL
jgi:hypothetical protein